MVALHALHYERFSLNADRGRTWIHDPSEVGAPLYTKAQNVRPTYINAYF